MQKIKQSCYDKIMAKMREGCSSDEGTLLELLDSF